MSFRDTLITCKECGKSFVFTVEEQRRLAEQGLPVTPPDFCAGCVRTVKYGDKQHGRIKWFNLEKGFGFIVQDSGGELFVHRSGVPLTEQGTLPELPDGQEVLYEVLNSPKGPQAVQVRRYEDGAPARPEEGEKEE